MLAGIAILVLSLIFLIEKLYKFSLEKALHNHICWCVSDDSKVHRCSLSLLDYVIIAQDYESKSHKPTYDISPIPEEYWVSRKDECVKDILRLYQSELSQQYFNGTLLSTSSVAKLSNEEYFMLTLYIFLIKHEDDGELCGKEMRTFKLKFDYGDGGYKKTYSLTDFGTAFFKLLYISTSVCVETERIKKINPYYGLEGTKTILDSKEIMYIGRN